MVCLRWDGGLEHLESLVTLPEVAVGGERVFQMPPCRKDGVSQSSCAETQGKRLV